MASIINDMLKEFNEELPGTELSHEGFDDYEDMDVKNPAKVIATSGEQKWGHRLDLLKDAIRALEALIDDGYPEPIILITEDDATLADLDAQIASLTMARSHVKKRPGVTQGRFKFSPAQAAQSSARR